MAQLAIHGGPKVRKKKFPAYRFVGEEEKQAAARVIDRGILSGFIGADHANFSGGTEVRVLETEWAKFFKVKHAIAVNSATSAIYCAVGAIGTEPGDEIIVAPYSMACSAVAPLVYGAIPVFADIEKDFFCISAESIEKRITPYTKAIIIVDIFGLPYDVQKINALAKKHKITIIEDAAQAGFAKYKDKYAGTLGDIGIHSLNVHKQIQTGEGGMVVTNDDMLAEKVRLIRNHAESVLDGRGVKSIRELVNMVGFNYRMTEITAAIAREQLRKLPILFKLREKNVAYLAKEFEKIPPLTASKIRQGCTHSYYQQALFYNEEITGISRNLFIEAVKAELTAYELRETEGVKISAGYVKPLYLQPIFQKRIAYGSHGWPWTSREYKGKVSYQKGICPIVELMHEKKLITHELLRPPMTKKDLDDVINAFQKVWENRSQLQ